MSVKGEKGDDRIEVNEKSLSGFQRDELTGEISELMVVAEGEERTTLFVWILVLCCSISGLLFGERGACFEFEKEKRLNFLSQDTIPVLYPVHS